MRKLFASTCALEKYFTKIFLFQISSIFSFDRIDKLLCSIFFYNIIQIESNIALDLI